MALGPIEVAVLGFPGSRFTGEIRPRIVELVQRGIVSVIDALFISKDADGGALLADLHIPPDVVDEVVAAVEAV